MKKIGDLLPQITPTQQRVIETAAAGGEDSALTLFQHTALCQTFLPYRDPGESIREWERSNGHVHLKVTAGEAFHPVTDSFVPVGLPFGPKARIVLMHINQQAMVAQSPVLQVEDTLTSFVRLAQTRYGRAHHSRGQGSAGAALGIDGAPWDAHQHHARDHGQHFDH